MSSSPSSSLSIWTVTVGNKPSRARFELPDLAAVNSIIVQLAACQQQLQHSAITTAAASPSWIDSKLADGGAEHRSIHSDLREMDDKDENGHNANSGGGKVKEEQTGAPTMHS